jgi:outer membrane protein
MKKIILLFVFAISSTIIFAQKQKIGHVDVQQIMQSLALKDSIQKKFLDYQSIYQKELERIQNELIQEEQRLAEEQKTLPEEIFQQRYQSLLRRKQEFQEVTYPEAQQRLQQKMTELQIPLEENLNIAIEKVAKENGFVYILQLEATLYAGGENITKLVRKELGLPEEAEDQPMGMIPGGTPMAR